VYKNILLFYLLSLLDSSVILSVTTRIEDAMFKVYEGITDKYKAQFRVLLANLKTNVPLREQIFAGQVSPREIAVMTAEVLSTFLAHELMELIMVFACVIM
jgi:DNA repair protein RadC